MDEKPQENAGIAAFRRAIDIAGSQAELARRIAQRLNRKIEQAHIWNWLNRDKKVPDWAVISVEAAVDRRVTRYEIRPDIYPPEERAA